MVRYIEYELTRCPGECMTERQERDTKSQANDIGPRREGGSAHLCPRKSIHEIPKSATLTEGGVSVGRQKEYVSSGSRLRLRVVLLI